jgi:hypothetical protein
MQQQKGTLADLAARVGFGYALGLSGPKTAEDLHRIVTIRNLFAHSASLLDFNEPAINDACAEFYTKERVADGLSGISAPQARYITACSKNELGTTLRRPLHSSDLLGFPYVDDRLP